MGNESYKFAHKPIVDVAGLQTQYTLSTLGDHWLFNNFLEDTASDKAVFSFQLLWVDQRVGKKVLGFSCPLEEAAFCQV